MTTGRAPPRCNPAAIAQASPSRQTRMSFMSGASDSACSHSPSALSGSQTTCVTPIALSSATISVPENMSLLLRAVGHLQRRDPDERLSRLVDPHLELRLGLCRKRLQDV